MRGPGNSMRKYWHALTIDPGRVRQQWQPPYWQEAGPFRDIPCRSCRKFDPARQACSVPYGTPSRKCAVAAIEANLHATAGQTVLEIGFGRWALARNLVRRGGGTWTGIDPRQPAGKRARIGHGGYGHAAAIPFPDGSFDLVYGIQTFEHWGQKAGTVMRPSRYADCMQEILRVLKPGGRVYLDAPMHYHGNEMFIMGDVDSLRRLFDDGQWEELVMERWRRDYQPLERFMPGAKVLAEWPIEISNYPESEITALLQSASAWLLTFSARKRKNP
ncbi:MAG TPA: class I SAM-dependent methyltransferase [Xanthomonadales bacterium]|nr:class I SAM-dependent methyltransferase [Xanthomonadales bacterium]